MTYNAQTQYKIELSNSIVGGRMGLWETGDYKIYADLDTIKATFKSTIHDYGNAILRCSDKDSILVKYYSDKTHQFIVSDGVIEEWQFENVLSAETAFNAFNRQKINLYFNTEPYFYQIRSSVYELHSRAMAFSIDQKECLRNL